jgi:hypothetical protein
MTTQKKFLHRTMLAVLCTLFTGSAQATSIVNLDNVAHEVRLEIAGSETTILLAPNQRWQSRFYPIKIKYETYTTPALERFGEYAIWRGGNIALQFNRKSFNKRY